MTFQSVKCGRGARFAAFVLALGVLAVAGVGTALAQQVTVDTRVPDKDIPLGSASSTDTRGIWSDGTTMWVANAGDGEIYAYTLSTKARDSSKDISLDTAGGNADVRGIWSDGTTMWVADDDDNQIYAYTLSNGNLDNANKFETLTDAGNRDLRGIWSDDTTMWVADHRDDKLYAYTLSTKARDAAKDFNLGGANGDPFGIWSDGTTMWVADWSDDKLYAYTLSSGSRNSAKDIDLATDNADPRGIWSDGDTMYVADHRDDKLYAYTLAPTVAITVNDDELAIGETATVTVTFSETVSGFEQGELTTSAGTLTNFRQVTTGRVYTYTLTPPTGSGTINLNVAADIATDADSKGNLAASQLTVAYDNTRPTVAIAVDDNQLTVGESTTVTVTFSEPVEGFAQGELRTSVSGTLSNFSEVTTGTVYTYTLTPPSTGSGTINLNVGANVAADGVGNRNTAATQVSVSYDTQAPTVAITVNDDELAIGETATVTVTFSETVSGFAQGELTTSAGTLTNFSEVTTGRVYTYTLSPPSTGTGAINLNVAANVVTDGNGNGNSAAT